MATATSIPWCSDGIEIKELSLAHSQRIGHDAWSRKKEQPLAITVRLALKSAFATAAANDALDDSTMHYGHLAKRLRSIKPVSEWESVVEFTTRVHEAICDQATARRLLTSCELTVALPKATLLGTRVSMTSRVDYTEDWIGHKLTLHLQSINIATLIGVNAHEREHKQPLLFDIWIFKLPESASDLYTEIEAELVKIVEPTSFETLESLILYTVNRLYVGLMSSKMPESNLRLRVEKPMAIPFAEAPVIEVFRTAGQMEYQADQSRLKACASSSHTRAA
ncbi:hypothetical protein MBLNU457_7573t1 [Dothideomycetes sp. NU457]